MNPALPAALTVALDALTGGRSGRSLAEKAQAISARYRSGAPSSQTIRDEDDALAYALTRMPATYAAVGAALDALSRRAPQFRPRTLADVGCGPGTAGWAALELFDSLAELALLDGNRRLLDLAGRLSPSGPVAVDLRLADIVRADIPASDLVVAAYVLTEMAAAEALTVAVRVWDATEGALVIVEPGTPQGWAGLMRVRSTLINLGAQVAAPCPHHAPCPIAPPDWCHFVQRLPRSRAHRAAKQAEAPFEDEKFAYLVAVRPTVALGPVAPRILAPPVQDKAGVSLKLCVPSGDLELRRSARRDKLGFRAVRHAGWGDLIDSDPAG